jgi:hypothetical protein
LTNDGTYWNVIQMMTFIRFTRTDWWQTLKLVLMLWAALMAIGFGNHHWSIGVILGFAWLIPLFFLVGLALRYLLFLVLLKAYGDFEGAYDQLAIRRLR